MTPTFDEVAIYEWEAWEDFLATRVMPGAVRITAEPVDSAARIIAAVPGRCRYFLFHVNCTTSARFVRDREELCGLLAQRGVRVLNASVTDISKPRLQRTCRLLSLPSTEAAVEGPPDELIMVKTARNSGGASDRRLDDRQQGELGVDRESPLVASLRSRFKEYPVFKRRDIPAGWWADDQIFMERFIANPRDRIYRVWFLIDRVSVAIATCRGNFKKFARTTTREFAHFVLGRDGAVDACASRRLPFLEGAVGLRDYLQLDYGAVDLVEDADGVQYVIDLNSTPGATVDLYDQLIEHLRTAM